MKHDIRLANISSFRLRNPFILHLCHFEY